jgi:hypothetical protein
MMFLTNISIFTELPLFQACLSCYFAILLVLVDKIAEFSVFLYVSVQTFSSFPAKSFVGGHGVVHFVPDVA